MSDAFYKDESKGSVTPASLATSYKLRDADLPIAARHVAALDPELQRRAGMLDEAELEVLRSIKTKLNAGLSERLKQAADTVGGFVW